MEGETETDLEGIGWSEIGGILFESSSLDEQVSRSVMEEVSWSFFQSEKRKTNPSPLKNFTDL